MSKDKVSVATREALPETIEGLREFINRAEKEIERIVRLVNAARVLLSEKEKGLRV